MDEIIYTLNEKFEYAYKGEPKLAEFLTLKAPTSRNISECATLKQAFCRAIPNKAGDEEKEEKQDKDNGSITGDDIIMIMSVSNDVDLSKVMLTGRELLSSGVALIDGETKLTKPLVDSMGIDDLANSLGEYMLNFIVASVLSIPKNKR